LTYALPELQRYVDSRQFCEIRSVSWNLLDQLALPVRQSPGSWILPRYYFDIKNGHRLIDPAGLDCKSDSEAMRSAVLIAKQVAVDASPDQSRHISVLNGDREEVGKVPVFNYSKEDHHGGQ
jgi:hypothetical protein